MATKQKKFVNPCRIIGRNIRRERLRAGLTQAALAWRSGVSPGTIRALEHGQRPYALFTTLAKVAGGLGIPIHKLCVGC